MMNNHSLSTTTQSLSVGRQPIFRFLGTSISGVRFICYRLIFQPDFMFYLADASSSYVPVHFTHLEASLYDETTNKKIATGDWGNHVMPHKAEQAIILPVKFAYSAINTSDTTCKSSISFPSPCAAEPFHLTDAQGTIGIMHVAICGQARPDLISSSSFCSRCRSWA